MKVDDTVCVVDFCDLCLRTLSQSRRDGIWALPRYETICRFASETTALKPYKCIMLNLTAYSLFACFR